MTQNEYLIEVMSKVDKFTNWVAKHHEVYSSDNNDIITGIFACVVITFLLGPFTKLASEENNKNGETSGSSFISIACIILVVMMFKTASHISDERYLENVKITLDDLEKVKPIDFNKLPYWVQDELKEEGYLKCEDIYEVFRDKKAQERQEATEAKRLKQIERIRGSKND